MEKRKSIIALILTAAIAVSFAACTAKPDSKETTAATEGVTEAVSGIPVTDKNGRIVTETVTNSKGETVTDKNGKAVTVVVTERPTSKPPVTGKQNTTAAGKKNESTGKDKKESTTKKKKEKTTATTATSKVKNPNTVKEIKVSKVTENSLKLSWDGVICDYYELFYKQKDAERWEAIDEKLDATAVDVSGLDSMTEYSFRLRAIIETKAGKSPSAYTFVNAKTKAQDKSRKLKIKVNLPARNSNKEKLIVYVKEDKKDKVKVYEGDVILDGKTVKIDETKQKFNGVVTVEARLKKLDVKRTAETDKDSVTVDISHVGIDIIDDEDK